MTEIEGIQYLAVFDRVKCALITNDFSFDLLLWELITDTETPYV